MVLKKHKDKNNGNLDLIDFFAIFMLTALTFYILINWNVLYSP